MNDVHGFISALYCGLVKGVYYRFEAKPGQLWTIRHRKHRPGSMRELQQARAARLGLLDAGTLQTSSYDKVHLRHEPRLYRAPADASGDAPAAGEFGLASCSSSIRIARLVGNRVIAQWPWQVGGLSISYSTTSRLFLHPWRPIKVERHCRHARKFDVGCRHGVS